LERSDCDRNGDFLVSASGVPNGIRTRVAAVKGILAFEIFASQARVIHDRSQETFAEGPARVNRNGDTPAVSVNKDGMAARLTVELEAMSAKNRNQLARG
jgi:hypothetical protein